MVPDFSQIKTIQDYITKSDGDRTIYYKGDKAFLIVNPHTLEVRCDSQLSQHLQTQYESVMTSRYFGRGGIEIVPTNQLSPQEIEDLIALSYSLTS